MADSYNTQSLLNALVAASKVLSERKEEINRLNVFPVPDGDTGTNMSLTLENVVSNIRQIPAGASGQDIRNAVTNGALMGARGNSGVITSQILRSFCEGLKDGEDLTTATLAEAFARAEEVAFSAVRKPVEGTILTVLKDSAAAAKKARKKKMSTDEALAFVAEEAFASVQRTPDLLPVLKENGVVDAGGYGLAIIIGAMNANLTGQDDTLIEEIDLGKNAEPKVEIEHINDWEGSRFRYCNEFLVDSDTLVVEDALAFLATMGDCELCVGATPKFKVHVHSNTPDQVLAYFLERGQISEVFIHNMQLQSEERNEKLQSEAENADRKSIGFVSVASGSGISAILESLGVDQIVSGGQTMNPSTKDLLDAVNKVNADAVIILPNNSNIVMAAQSAANLAEVPCAVVPTKSAPEAFTALFEADPDASLEENVEAMTEAIQDVHVGEVTFAIKDSKDAHDHPIHIGDVIGIADGAIEAVDDSVQKVVISLLNIMEADSADTLTILAGEDMSDEDLDMLVDLIQERYEDIEIDPQRGEQPLYPIIMAVE